MSFFDDASLAFLPSGAAGKDGKAYSIKPTDGTGDFTFSRGSNLAATRVGADGLIEKGRENLLLQSNSFNTAPWGAPDSDVTIGQIGYDGSNNAWLFSKTDTNGRVQQNISTSGVKTFSVYAKAGTKNWMALRVDGSGVNTYFDLQNGVLGSSPQTIEANIESVGNGWYRCSVSFSSAITRVRIYVGDANNDTSGTSGSIYIQDSQLEIGLAATDYIESGATTGKAGLLEDEPRFDYSGGATCPSLLLEPSRTNLITQSEYFEGFWLTTRITPTPNAETSPEGLQNAYKFQQSATDTNGGAFYVSSIGSTGDMTYSVFLKSGTCPFVRILENSSGTTRTTWFNVDAGSVGTKNAGHIAEIKPYGNDWYRCSISFTSTQSTFGVLNYLSGADNTTTAGLNTNIYAYGAQIEDASYPTSYIPNHSGGTITRGADDCSRDSISALINSPAGVFYNEVILESTTLTNDRHLIVRGDASNYVNVYFNTFGNIVARIKVAGVDTFLSTSITQVENKVAVLWQNNKYALFVNGVKKAENLTGATFPAGTLNKIDFDNVNSNTPFYGNVKQTLVFPEALSDADCINITSL